jgi:AraC-like DNA-binding protein
MDRPAEMKFSSPTLSRINITGNLPDWCQSRIPYAQAEQIIIDQGTIVCQFYSHILFFMEVVEFSLHKDIEASYLIRDPSLFLFLMLDGGMSFLTPDGKPIADAPASICYVTYNKTGEYVYRMPAGKYRLCYLCPRTIWITKNLERYPRLKPFMERMARNDDQYGHMPACGMDSVMEESLAQLFKNEEAEGEDLEPLLLRDAKKLIDNYKELVDAKLAQRAYRIREYLEENYADSTLSNLTLADKFNTTEKTLIENFKEEFNTTPHTYLIQVRMEHAKRMLTTEKKQVSEVFGKVGYRDLHSFSAQFRKTFKNTPLDYLKGRFLPFFYSF